LIALWEGRKKGKIKEFEKKKFAANINLKIFELMKM
jgi:hypothetical protein